MSKLGEIQLTEKHGSTEHCVRTVESVDGSKTADGSGGVTLLTLESGENALPVRGIIRLFSE